MKTESPSTQPTHTFHSIEHAEQYCCRLRVVGRQHLRRGQWNEAVAIYGTAFEISHQLIGAQSASKCVLDRYLNTALEFAYVLGKSTYPADLDLLLPLMRNRLKPIVPPPAIENLIHPFKDIVYGPESEVDYWMAQRFAMEEMQGKTKH